MDRKSEFDAFFLENTEKVSSHKSDKSEPKKMDEFDEKVFQIATRISKVIGNIRENAERFVGSFSIMVVVENEMSELERDAFASNCQSECTVLRSEINKMQKDLKDFVEQTRSRVGLRFFFSPLQKKERLDSYTSVVTYRDEALIFLTQGLGCAMKAFDVLTKTRKYLDKKRDAAHSLQPFAKNSKYVARNSTVLPQFLNKYMPCEKDDETSLHRFSRIGSTFLPPPVSPRHQSHLTREFSSLPNSAVGGFSGPTRGSTNMYAGEDGMMESLDGNNPSWQRQSQELVKENGELSRQIVQNYEKVKEAEEVAEEIMEMSAAMYTTLVDQAAKVDLIAELTSQSESYVKEATKLLRSATKKWGLRRWLAIIYTLLGVSLLVSEILR